jgi:hypothetical protein
MGKRNVCLFGERQLLLDIAPSADFEPAADPAEAVGLFGGALGVADAAREGPQRDGFEDSLLSGLQNFGVHYGLLVNWF